MSIKMRAWLPAAFLIGILPGAGAWNFVRAATLPAKPAPQADQTNALSSAAKQVIGTIKSIEGKSITVTTDQGTSSVVLIPDTARVVRVDPGQTDLRNATKIALADLQVGDRVLVRGALSDDATSFVATVVMGMKRAAIQAKQQLALDEWKKRGVGGLVSRVDIGAGVVTISFLTPTGSRSMSIFTNKDTILRRYAPDSVKIEDARPGTLAQIKAGDQLQARGARNIDGTQLTADEVITGAFRNIAGTIEAIDTTNGTLTVNDLATKKRVTVLVTTQSQIRKLPPGVAQGIAARVKAAASGKPADNASGGTTPGSSGPANGDTRQGDFQQVVNRMPQAALSDLHKDDAVMIVATEADNPANATAVMLVGGVEPILTASPTGQGMSLSPWSLGAGGGDASEANQ